MKLAAAVCLFAAGAKAFAPVAAPRTSRTVVSAAPGKSTAIPFLPQPKNLDGSLPGDVGFDPAGFTNVMPRPGLIGGNGARSIKWYREAEITHARVAMLAALGWIFPELTGINLFEKYGGSLDDPISLFGQIPEQGKYQIISLIAVVEHIRIKRVIFGDFPAGDTGLGQGGWNPFAFDYTAEEFYNKQTQEIKNGRLAMLGISGMFSQALVTGKPLLAQLTPALATQDFVQKAGLDGSGFVTGSGFAKFFPEGI
jgi:hypothetical protein